MTTNQKIVELSKQFPKSFKSFFKWYRRKQRKELKSMKFYYNFLAIPNYLKFAIIFQFMKDDKVDLVECNPLDEGECLEVLEQYLEGREERELILVEQS